MQLIYTDEAKSLLNESYPFKYEKLRRGTLRKFLHDGSGTIFACRREERASAASMYTSGVDAAIKKIEVMLQPFAHLQAEGVFDGYTPVQAYESHMYYWDTLLSAVRLVAMFDLLVALTYKYPGLVKDGDPAKVRKLALIYTMRPLVRTSKATRIVNSGRPFAGG